MRDFDQERAERATLDHTLKIGGRELRFRPAVSPETFAKVADLQGGTYRDQFDLPGSEPEQGGEPLTVYRLPTEVEVVKILDGLFLDFLDPDSHGAWRMIRQDTENPVTYLEMWALIDHMIAVQMGRPTTPASNSGGGGGENGTKLTDVSASPAGASN
jgi:hypothetical protein